MSIIESIKTFIATYNGLQAGAALQVDQLGNTPTQYGIMPLPGARIVETYLDDGTLREFPFAINSMESTADELERINNSDFYEALADWFETQTQAGTLPTLETSKTATKIEALGWGYLFEPGDSGTGIYQIQCKLTFEQQA
jgi:hypothetical protein